jgi:anti-anti-sigma factor
MPEASVVPSSTSANNDGMPSTSPALMCSWKEGCYGACWVHVAGELDLTTRQRLRHTLAAAQLQAFLLVLDLRELTFVDRAGMQVILDAVGRARRDGGQLVLVRGPAEVDNVFKATEGFGSVTIIELDSSEPASALFDLERTEHLHEHVQDLRASGLGARAAVRRRRGLRSLR